MNTRFWLAAVIVMSVILAGIRTVNAAESVSVLETAMSETFDIWRDGRYEQLFEKLAHRGKTSREAFVKKMKESTIRPACCWQKMENFKVLNEKRTEATVYVKVGLEGTAGSADSTTREFKMTHQEGVWKMQLADVLSISGTTAKKAGAKRHAKKKTSPYPE
jgi:hypothetical protein